MSSRSNTDIYFMYLFLNVLTIFHIYKMEVEGMRNSQKDFQFLRLDFLKIYLVKTSILFKMR